MNAINNLPDSTYWSIIPDKNVLKILTSPSRVIEFRPNKSKNLLTGEYFTPNTYDLLKNLLDVSVSEYQSSSKIIFHAYYELGDFWYKTCNLPEDTILGYWLEFQEESPLHLKDRIDLERIEWNLPDYSLYREMFFKGKESLYNGDCYQFNLTMPILGRFQNLNLLAFAGRFLGDSSKRGRFASLTRLDNKVLYSNSPECLGEIESRDNQLYFKSCPIKGTQSTEKLSKNKAWKKLKESPKDESELFMITDLLRNDLNQIGQHWVEVKKKKAPLFVNNLVHSFSELEAQIDNETTLYQVLRSVFPGGSITGVPKKRVMKILKKLENKKRGFYCGSSLIFGKGAMKLSINIRSGEIDLEKNQICYHSGGGITVNSTPENEFTELLDKFTSFVSLLNE